MRFTMMLITKIMDKEVRCFCSFCKGAPMLSNVEHFKLFADNAEQFPEFYLNIRKDTKECEIVPKT